MRITAAALVLALAAAQGSSAARVNSHSQGMFDYSGLRKLASDFIGLAANFVNDNLLAPFDAFTEKDEYYGYGDYMDLPYPDHRGKIEAEEVSDGARVVGGGDVIVKGDDVVISQAATARAIHKRFSDQVYKRACEQRSSCARVCELANINAPKIINAYFENAVSENGKWSCHNTLLHEVEQIATHTELYLSMGQKFFPRAKGNACVQGAQKMESFLRRVEDGAETCTEGKPKHFKKNKKSKGKTIKPEHYLG